MEETNTKAITIESRSRKLAYSIIQESYEHLRANRLALSRKLLSAARALLEEYGGVSGEEGVWLLTAEAHIPVTKEEHENALEIFKQALELAQSELGTDHYATGVCHTNMAETLLNLGELVESEDHYSAALDTLVDALDGNTDEMLAEYLASTISETEAGFEKLRQTDSP